MIKVLVRDLLNAVRYVKPVTTRSSRPALRHILFRVCTPELMLTATDTEVVKSASVYAESGGYVNYECLVDPKVALTYLRKFKPSDTIEIGPFDDIMSNMSPTEFPVMNMIGHYAGEVTGIRKLLWVDEELLDSGWGGCIIRNDRIYVIGKYTVGIIPVKLSLPKPMQPSRYMMQQVRTLKSDTFSMHVSDCSTVLYAPGRLLSGRDVENVIKTADIDRALVDTPTDMTCSLDAAALRDVLPGYRGPEKISINTFGLTIRDRTVSFSDFICTVPEREFFLNMGYLEDMLAELSGTISLSTAGTVYTPVIIKDSYGFIGVIAKYRKVD